MPPRETDDIQSTSSQRTAADPRMEAPQVLVVDDQESVRRLTRRILEYEGLAVHEACDGREALQLIELNATLIDLVVSDVVMPWLNGVELLNLLSVSYPSIPVILMSAYGHPELARLGVTAPCAVLAKPFLPQLLMQEVRRCIGSRSWPANN
jgi:two-component system, cell cycle sensor histidine kinase and response regulator CckA